MQQQSSEIRNSSPLKIRAAFAVILGLGLALRLTGIKFGFPGKFRPDEEYLIYTSLALSFKNPNPHFFVYPSLWFYVLALYFFLLRSVGEYWGWYPQGFSAYLDSTLVVPAYLWARVLSAGVGTLSIVLAYRLGKLLENEMVGLASALLLAFSFLHAKESHFATTDAALTFWCLLALYLMAKSIVHGKLRALLFASITVGLAISTKYSGAPLGLPLSLTILFYSIQHCRRKFFRSFVFVGTLCGILAVLAFVCTSPFCVFDRAGMRDAFQYQINFLRDGIGINMPYGWPWLFRYSLPVALGTPLFPFSIAALFLPAFFYRQSSKWQAYLVLASFPLGLGASLVRSKWLFIRYVLPAIPVLLVFASAFSYQLCRPLKGKLAPAAFVIFIAVLAAEPALRAVQHSVILCEADTRELARKWLFNHVPEGTPIYYRGAFPYTRPELAPRFRISDYDSLLNGGTPPSALAYLIVDSHPITYFSPSPPAGISSIIEQRGTLAVKFEPFSSTRKDEIFFDLADAYYAPMAGFSAAERPGPALQIYELNFSPDGTNLNAKKSAQPGSSAVPARADFDREN